MKAILLATPEAQAAQALRARVVHLTERLNSSMKERNTLRNLLIELSRSGLNLDDTTKHTVKEYIAAEEKMIAVIVRVLNETLV